MSLAFALLLCCKFTYFIHTGGEHGSRMVAAGKDVGNTHILLHTLTKWTLQLSQPFNNTKNNKKSSKREYAYIFSKTLRRREHAILLGRDVAVYTPSGAWTCNLSRNVRDLH